MLKQRASLFVLLIGLFMFQSIWNVAAAFCLHENETQNVAEVAHFGHHQTQGACHSSTLSESSLLLKDLSTTQDHLTEANALDANSQINFDDNHHDHVPSMSLLVLVNKQDIPLSLGNYHVALSNFSWLNLYQSPHIIALSPPPQIAPLLVG